MTPNMMIPQPPQGPPQMQQPRFSLKDTQETKCPCGSVLFRDGFMLRTLSRLLTGEAKDTLVTVPVLVCDKCGVPFEQMLPDELKTVKLV
jgi:hypothetical protein